MIESSRRKFMHRLSSWGVRSMSDQPEIDNNDIPNTTGCRKRRQTISSPYRISHDIHITYNHAKARFEGTTNKMKWLNKVNQQFGVPCKQLPRVIQQDYEERIPAVLVMLKERFMESKGYLVPHIFRESPSKEDRDLAIEQINQGKFNGHKDTRIFADLIKVWFRDLPQPILKEIDHETMDKIVESGTDCVHSMLCKFIAKLERSILYWLADILVEVSKFEEINHMGIEQLAIIVAPNLFRIETTNPMVAVIYSKATVDFFRCVLQYRKSVLEEPTNNQQS